MTTAPGPFFVSGTRKRTNKLVCFCKVFALQSPSASEEVKGFEPQNDRAQEENITNYAASNYIKADKRWNKTPTSAVFLNAIVPYIVPKSHAFRLVK